MKKLLLAVIALSSGMFGFAQEDSTKTGTKDTIKIGGMVIIKDKDNGEVHGNGHGNIYISNHKKKKNPNIKTNWVIFDIG